jgi:hypothetical protein
MVNSAERFDWTEEAVATLRLLVAQDNSAGQICTIMGGGLTRSAVLGKCHRLNISTNGGTYGNARHGVEGRTAQLRERQEDRAAKAPKDGRTKQDKPSKQGAALRDKPNLPRLSLVTGWVHTPAAAAQDHAKANLQATARQRNFDPASAPEGARLVGLVDLEKGECRWPLFDTAPMIFCGCAVTIFDRRGQPNPYCDHHQRLSIAKVLP